MTKRERIPSEPKSASILVKCSPAWRATVKASADKAGLSVGQYLRQAANEKMAGPSVRF